MAVAQALEPVASPATPNAWRALARRAAAFVLICVVVIAAWEGYKALGEATKGMVPGTAIRLPVRTDDRSLPHTWRIVGSLFEPVRASDDTLLISNLLRYAAFTWFEAAVGFVIGGVFGFALGVVFVQSRLLERGLMPYVVASQAVPLLAIAPMIVIWGSQAGLPAWLAVSIIAAYLTFFPVAINTLRGLQSPDPAAIELMRSYAATQGQILWKLRVPAALPYIFTALKISATSSIVGAIVGELPSGIQTGLGRALLTFSQYFTTGPERLFGAVLISALVGLAFFSLVTLAELWLVPARRRLE
ncbi:MAG: ABC transporter permease subunit [Anaerolineales bacterium]|nr:ABC transporter permease subunit [Anaerolineales bacterium]